MLKSKAYPNRNLLIICTFGEMEISSISEAVLLATQNPEFKPEYDTIFDLRHTELEVSREGLDELISAVKAAPGFQGKRQTAFLTSRPAHVVMAEILSMPANEFPMEIRAFSSPNAAIHWLKLSDFSTEEFEHEVELITSQLKSQ